MHISIFAPTEQHPQIQQILQTVPSLAETISLRAADESIPLAATSILVHQQEIMTLPDWHNQLPPLMFPPLPFTSNHLLGAIFSRLGDLSRTSSYLESTAPTWVAITQSLVAMQQQTPGAHAQAEPAITDALGWHNLAVARHYGFWPAVEITPADICHAYETALQAATDNDLRLFTLRHYATLLADLGQQQTAATRLREGLAAAQHPDAQIGLQAALISVLMDELTVPYDPALLEEIKQRLWTNLQHYETQARKLDEALLLLDATHIANISNSFSESLGYITKAVRLLEEEEQPELTAQAQLKKGILLYTWAQQNQPQFYRGALDAFLAALRVFTRENDPATFADIHHYLGILYAEIPDEVKKKSVWAAVSVSSFNEALQFYNKVDHPYSFGMICHHFGNAYTRYPAAIHSDNFDKALSWYREALDVRPADRFPLERSHTLSNYLSASWQAGNPEEVFNVARHADMVEKATELLQLTTDPDLQAEAREHLHNLGKLRQQYDVTAEEKPNPEP